MAAAVAAAAVNGGGNRKDVEMAHSIKDVVVVEQEQEQEQQEEKEKEVKKGQEMDQEKDQEQGPEQEPEQEKASGDADRPEGNSIVAETETEQQPLNQSVESDLATQPQPPLPQLGHPQPRVRTPPEEDAVLKAKHEKTSKTKAEKKAPSSGQQHVAATCAEGQASSPINNSNKSTNSNTTASSNSSHSNINTTSTVEFEFESKAGNTDSAALTVSHRYVASGS